MEDINAKYANDYNEFIIQAENDYKHLKNRILSINGNLLSDKSTQASDKTRSNEVKDIVSILFLL